MLSSHKEAIKLYTNKMALKNQPIGIFDSGVGGLTVANAIKQALPGESLIYFGDTAHLPYGDKSAEAIIGLLKQAATDPEALHKAPVTTPVGRPDEVTAARSPIIRYMDFDA